MRGTKAKRLRREVYKGLSSAAKGTRYSAESLYTLVATGRRRAYQARKRGT